MEVKGERNAILIRRQINRKALGAVLDTDKIVETLVWLCIYTVPDDETVDPGREEVVDQDHSLQQGQHGGAHTHPAHQGSSSFFSLTSTSCAMLRIRI
jgi:hypothetical protein